MSVNASTKKTKLAALSASLIPILGVDISGRGIVNLPLDFEYQKLVSIISKLSIFSILVWVLGSLFFGELILAWILSLIVDVKNIKIPALDDVSLSGMLYIDLFGPIFETLIQISLIRILSTFVKGSLAVCVVVAIFSGALHGIDGGIARFIITSYSFFVFSTTYYIFRSKNFFSPTSGVAIVHVANNFVTTFGILVSLLLDRYAMLLG